MVKVTTFFALQPKINNLNRIRVAGTLYEWNDLFASYWSVEGKSAVLTKELAKDFDMSTQEEAKRNSEDK